MNYWLEALNSSLDEHAPNLVLSDAQREAIAKDLELAEQMHFEASGADHIPNPVELENERLKSRLKWEQELITCPQCGGRGVVGGYDRLSGRSWSGTCSCHSGKVHPRGIAEPRL